MWATMVTRGYFSGGFNVPLYEMSVVASTSVLICWRLDGALLDGPGGSGGAD